MNSWPLHGGPSHSVDVGMNITNWYFHSVTWLTEGWVATDRRVVFFFCTPTSDRNPPWSIWAGYRRSWILWQTSRRGQPQSAATGSHGSSAHFCQQRSTPLWRSINDMSVTVKNNTPRTNMSLTAAPCVCVNTSVFIYVFPVYCTHQCTDIFQSNLNPRSLLKPCIHH